MAGLSKQAAGLPRFMMDCGWWLKGRRWRRPTLAELGLHQAGISFANERGTDGILPGPADELATVLSLPGKDVAKTLPLLLTRGVWAERRDGDYEIVDFLEHNPSNAEVSADRRKRKRASEAANHKRHHVDKNTTDPDCELCSDSETGSDTATESQADSRRKGWKEGIEETSSSSRFPDTTSPATARPNPEEEEDHIKAKVDRSFAAGDWYLIEARRRMANRRSSQPLVMPDRWMLTTVAELHRQHPDGPPTPTQRNVVICSDDECINGHILDELGDAHPCPTCSPSKATL